MKPTIARTIRPLDLRHLVTRFLKYLRDPRTPVRTQVGLAVALSVGLLLSVALLLGFQTPLDPLLHDLVYQPISPTRQVVIIAIDKKSLDELGPWPWPRTVHAGLLERLSAAPPRLIAFDILLSQATPEDPGFASAIAKAGNVLLTTVGVEAAAFPVRRDQLPQFDVLLLPAADLRTVAPLGHRMVLGDPDGIVRRIPVAISTSSNAVYPALGVRAAQAYLGVGEIKYNLPARRVLLGSVSIPVDEYGRMLVGVTGIRDPIPTYSYSDVFQGRTPASTFAGKIVLIGGTSTSEPETYITPLTGGSNSTYNVTLQADLADMLVSQPPRVLYQQGALDQIGVTLLCALIAGLTLPHLRPLSSAAVTILYLLFLLLFAFDAFGRGLIVRLLFPGLALIFTFLILAFYRYLSEERRRIFLASLFRRYVPAESVSTVVDAIDSGELPLGGARRLVSVLYCDLRGFSALSEGLAPSAVLDLVNRYLEVMMREVHIQDGTVNKPMGDSLVALWNAPLDQPDHAPRAVNAARAIRRSLLRAQPESSGEGSVNMGMGIATGWAILGNIQALGKTEYTLVGETVNVAARISAFAGNNQILADTATVQDLPAEIERRELSPVRIRGRREPLAVWEIQDMDQPAYEEAQEE